jgi:hypothetical protein
MRPGAVNATLMETPDNGPCRDVFTRAGFAAAGEGRFVLEGEAITPGHIGQV